MKKREGQASYVTFISRLVAILVLALCLSSMVLAVSGQFTNDPDLYFTGSSSDPGTLYQDAIDGNQDVGIQLCDVGQRYVGAFYAMNVLGTWRYVPISYNSYSTAMALTDTDAGSGCYRVTEGFVTVSPSELTTPDPDIKKAAFPGKLYIGYAASSNPGTVTSFVFGGAGATLLGDFTMQRSFSEATRQITVQSPTISFQTSSTTFAKSATDASFGISDDRRLVMGVCDDTDGELCNDGSVLSSASFPALFNSGLSASDVNDGSTHTKYVVANGIGKPICIGANLKITIHDASPDPVYYSQNLIINYTITNPRDIPYEINGGNVQVSTPFRINISIYNASSMSNVVYSVVQTISDTIAPDAILERELSWPAYAHSGIYTVRITADTTNVIVECNEADNFDTENFELKPITIPLVYIDGELSDEFDYPNVPYNLSFYFKNSDNDTLRNANVSLAQINGLMLAAPTQTYNRTTGSNTTVSDGLVTESIVKFVTDYGGTATFTYLPTYNRLYLEEYSYLDLPGHIGNYSIYFEGVQQDGESFKFVLDGELSSTYPLTVLNTSYIGDPADKEIPNRTMVIQVMDFIYRTFANFLDTILG